MRRLWTIIQKEVLHILRDTRTLALVVLMPALLLLLTGTATAGETGNISLAICDQSHSAASRWYIDRFWVNGYFRVVEYAGSEDELIELIDQDTANAGLFIPADFGRQLATGEPAAVQFYVNDADPASSQSTLLGLETIHQAALQELVGQQLARVGYEFELPLTMHLKYLYNPDARTTNYMVPGLLAVLLQIQSLLLTAFAIVREREQGTMEQLIVTPIRPWELMLGKILPYVVVAFLNCVTVLAIAILWFKIPASGNIGLLLGLSFIFILGSLGMGVLVSNISGTQMQAMYISAGVILLPSFILSGLILPRTNMPWIAYYIGELLPVTHYLDIIRGVLLKGVGADFLWPSIWPLCVLCVVFFVASVVFFQKRMK